MSHIDDLLGAMSVDEKLGQLTMASGTFAVTGPSGFQDLAAIVRAGGAGSVINLWGAEATSALQGIAIRESRLGIPILFSLDVIHGFKTLFPIPLAEMAAFDDDLWERTARAAAREATAAGIHLSFAPMLDVARDPRWGRMAEGPGEDPILGARLARAKIRGFQGVDLASGDTLGATAKHLAGYGLPQAGREYASVDISERTLHEIYLPPFEAAVRANVAAIMPAFHDIAGAPMTANRAILRDLVRGTWGFSGVLVSDYNAIAELINHGVAGDISQAAELALRAGVDIDMMARAYERGLPVALKRDPTLMALIDDAVRRVLRLKERLGLFDDTSPRRNGQLIPAANTSTRALAREAARRSIVLLTNHGVLPLDPSVRRISVVGPLGDTADDMLGPWAAAGTASDAITILDGLRAALPDREITYASGVAVEGTDETGIMQAVQTAQSADLVILCLGESRNLSGEAASRAEPGLPGRQADLAHAVFETGKPLVMVLTSGRPLIIPDLIDAAGAVLATWYLGNEAGNAIADIILGKSAPTGRLPVAWPRSVGQIPIFHAQRPSGRPENPQDFFTSKYRDVANDPQFPFGHGLSYTQFRLSGLKVSRSEIKIGEALDVSVEVTNCGTRPGEETVLVFIHDLVATIAQPALSFRASVKITLAPGETAEVAVTLPPEAFAFVGPDLTWITEQGAFDILVGPKAERTALLATRVMLRA